jgi:hypothetical protein
VTRNIALPGDEWTERSDRNVTVMWIFFTLVGLGLAFMLYALAQFHGESKGRGAGRRRAAHTKPAIAGEGRVLHLSSKQLARNESGKTGTTGWSHSNGEIQFRRISGSGDVFVRRIRPSAKSKFDISGRSGSSKAG